MRNFDDPIPMFQMLSLKNTMKRIHMKFKRPFWFFSPAAVLAHVLYLVRERKIKESNIREKGKNTRCYDYFVASVPLKQRQAVQYPV
jgi:hypothetical protein